MSMDDFTPNEDILNRILLTITRQTNNGVMIFQGDDIAPDLECLEFMHNPDGNLYRIADKRRWDRATEWPELPEREWQTIRYGFSYKPSDLKTSFTDDEKARLRPIAEVFAMLDANAFFGNTYPDRQTGEMREWYEMYLPEAHAFFEGCGGIKGWAGKASFVEKQPS